MPFTAGTKFPESRSNAEKKFFILIHVHLAYIKINHFGLQELENLEFTFGLIYFDSRIKRGSK